jgi:predicted GTPase
VTTKQKCNIPQQCDWQFNALLGSTILAISVFRRAISITRYSEDVLATKMINDKLLHRFLSSFAHQFADSILAIIQLNVLKFPHDIQISCLDYIT